MKLSEKEASELRMRRTMLNDATYRVGEIDMQIAQLEAMKQQARVEAARLGNEFQQAAMRAGQAHGVDPSRYALDVETGEFRLKNAGPRPAPSLKVVPKKTNGRARA